MIYRTENIKIYSSVRHGKNSYSAVGLVTCDIMSTCLVHLLHYAAHMKYEKEHFNYFSKVLAFPYVLVHTISNTEIAHADYRINTKQIHPN